MTSPHENPDGRDLFNFADAVNAGRRPHPENELEQTYLHVNNAMQADSTSLSDVHKTHIWEDIMTTLAITPDHPVSNRTKRLQASQAPSSHRKRSRLQWTPLASLAAAILVVLAGIGGWRSLSYDATPPTPVAREVAGLAPQGVDVSQLAATPEATPDTSAVTTVPIFQVVDEQPMEGPVIWLTSAGVLYYDDGSGSVTVIAEGVENVMNQATNVISYNTNDPAKNRTTKEGTNVTGTTMTYYNLISGQTLIDDGTFSSYLGDPNSFGPLRVLTIADAPNEWSVVNFETMQSKSLSVITGGQYRSSDSITVSVSEDFSTIAVGTSQYESESSAILYQQSGLPGDVAIMSADFNTVRWVAVPDNMPAVGNMALSPDGSKIALIASDSSTMVIAIMDVVTGKELTRSETAADSSSTLQWLPDGSGYITVAPGGVMQWSLDGSEPTALLESEGSIVQLPSMRGSEMMYLMVSNTNDQEKTVAQLIVLDPAAGTKIVIEGRPWFMGMSTPTQFSVGLSPIPVVQTDGSTDAILVHPITGEIIPDLMANTYDPMFDPEFTPVADQTYGLVQAVTTAQLAPVSAVVLTSGEIAIVTTTADAVETRIVTLPADAADKQLLLSEDGHYLTAGAAWESSDGESFYMLDLSNKNSEWVQGVPGTRIDFVKIDSE